MDQTKDKDIEEEIKEETPAAEDVKKEKKDEEKTAEKKEPKKTKKAEDEKAKAELAKLREELDAANDKYMRMIAEYDNFRRRTAKEKDGIYADAYADVMKAIFPIMDNIERAAKYKDAEQVAKGIEMIGKSFADALEKLGAEEIPCMKDGKGLTFDPNLHNAVMHIEDDSYGEGEIVEVFQKGYRKGDKILRYAMVKVAN